MLKFVCKGLSIYTFSMVFAFFHVYCYYSLKITLLMYEVDMVILKYINIHVKQTFCNAHIRHDMFNMTG